VVPRSRRGPGSFVGFLFGAGAGDGFAVAAPPFGVDDFVHPGLEAFELVAGFVAFGGVFVAAAAQHFDFGDELAGGHGSDLTLPLLDAVITVRVVSDVPDHNHPEIEDRITAEMALVHSEIFNLRGDVRTGFAAITRVLERHSDMLNNHTELLSRQGEILNHHTEQLERHGVALDGIVEALHDQGGTLKQILEVLGRDDT
jgi:hypothetical protein